MSVIWIFREPRSGSTAFSESISFKLGKTHRFVPISDSYVHPIENATDYVLSTHSFEILKHIHLYDNPILIRCTRRDKAEQCLSHLALRHINNNRRYKFSNIFNDEERNSNKAMFENATPTTFTKKEVDYYVDMQLEWSQLWKTYATKVPNITVYYEDLWDTGVDLSILGLGNISLEQSSTLKLPDYKDTLILNSHMIRKWVSDRWV